MNIVVRNEETKDYRRTEEVAREAFWNLYFPGAAEHYVVHQNRAHNMCIFVYGAVTLYRAPFQTLPLTHTLIQALGSSPFARRYWGNLG